MQLPMISIGSYRVSRLIIGGNPYSGISHHSAAKSKEMEDYYTADRIIADLREAERCEINTVLACADRHIMRILNEYRNAGGRIQWIAQTAKGSEYANLMEHIRQIACYQPIAIYHHGGTTNRLYDAGKLDVLHDVLALIRDLGIATGLGTHDPQVLKYCYYDGYDADFYVCALYNHTRHRELYLDADRDTAISTIQAVNLPVLSIKVLAAGRSRPLPAFRFALVRYQSIDAIAVGMYAMDQPNQICENVQMVAHLIKCQKRLQLAPTVLDQMAIPGAETASSFSRTESSSDHPTAPTLSFR